MKRIVLLVTLFLAFAGPATARALQQPGLTGTWEGVLHVGGLDIDMEITLVLEEKGGIVSGRISDDWGFTRGAIVDPVLKNGVFAFKTTVEAGSNDHEMACRMTVSDGRMTGQWESLGSFGDWSLVKIDSTVLEARRTFNAADMLGVWRGPAAFKSSPGRKNVCTLALEEKDGKLIGSLSDQNGTLYTRVNVIKLEGNHLFLEIAFTAADKPGSMAMDLDFRSAAKMKAAFDIKSLGQTGIWSATKQVAK